MAWEDLWWEISSSIKEKGLQKKFDKQLEKMKTQEKHKYRDTRSSWEYAYNKVMNNEKINKKN
tara:strand:- start:43 stop:231 length:189 start_codon:yes stop_codon:yes gene_type:complete